MEINMEKWDVLDRFGRKTGETVERGQPLPKGAHHLIVDVWIRNKRGEYLISRRAPDKHPEPGRWATTCGSVLAGEDSLTAAIREAQEELGIVLYAENGRRVKRFSIPGDCYVDCWLFEQEADIDSVVLQLEETDAAKWATADEIRALSNSDQFLRSRRLPYLEEFLNNIFDGPRLYAACITTHNIAAMVDFYKKVFMSEPEIDGPDHRFLEAQLIIFHLTDTETQTTQNTTLIYDTLDVDAEYERLFALGIAQGPPTDKPWGVRSFIIKDPDGNLISFKMDA